ncbi:hypothetical protein [Burkholderia thailandensis]|uniref:hypothetical protein n=1 Tax=Burkholderia thailandensis TaxID=57975 RepID=UPI0005F1CCE7|nr:hypothetical protein [Burkholderia thailandensis]AOJ55200.1 hypothetical protein AQ477_00805 [Burkholderia thailandensis]KXF60797.1 hypothetical protein AQ476_05515 [Burkholderia thailandensis]PNE75144.1 hypothetical protein A8H37_26005 [Burkholderia thailandensis]
MKGLKFDRLVTLAYRQRVTDKTRAECDCFAFRSELERQGLASAAWLRRQQSGQLNLHVAVAGRINYREARAFWRDLVDGNINVLRMRDSTAFASLLAEGVQLY